MKNHMRRRAAVVFVMVSSLIACRDGATSPGESKTVVEVASAHTRLSTLVTALRTAELEASVAGTGPFTVFAPINMAFEALPNGTVDALLTTAHRQSLTQIMRYHIVSGRYTRAQLTDGLTLTTLSGALLSVRVAMDGLITVDGAAVIDADINASNGVIHTVGRVLTQGLDVVQLAAVMPDLSTLAGAITASGLAATLSATGSNFTIFAPNNASFAALGDAVPADPAALAQMLQLQVVEGLNPSNMLNHVRMLRTLLGPELSVSIHGSAIQITGPTNTVNVTATDLMARNGIIHVIDAVLLLR